jgi:voltage-gated potassium channel
MVLIVLSVILVITETALGSASSQRLLIHTFADLLNTVFILELLLRAWISRRKRRFLRNYWLDMIAVLPLGGNWRVLRVLRLLRLIRIGVLLNRQLASIMSVGGRVQIGLFSLLSLIILSAALMILQLEGAQNPDFATLWDAVSWSVLTLVAAEPMPGTAETEGGWLVTLILMISGLTMFAVVTGVVSAVMIDKLKRVVELRLVDLDELRGHVVICGWNRGAVLILQELQMDPLSRNRYIVIVAEFETPPEHELRDVDPSRIYFYSGDYTRLEVLEEVGIEHASQAILLADATRPRSDQDRDARTVLAALTIEKLQPRIHTCAQMLDRRNNVQLRVAGVEDVVVGDELTSHLIATSARNQGLTEVLTELLTVKFGNQLYKLQLPSGWEGITFAQAAQRVKEDYDAILIALERRENGQRQSLVNPSASIPLQKQDQLIVIARTAPGAPLRIR